MIRRFFFMCLCAAACCLAAGAQAQADTLAGRPLTVEGLFALIDQNSRALKLGALALDEAAADAAAARSARLPAVNASLTGGYLGNAYITDRSFAHGIVAHNPHGVNDFALEAVQVIYSGGAISASVQISELARRLSALSLEQTRADVRILTLGWLFDLHTVRNQQRTLAQNIALARQVLADMQARYEQGTLLRNDLTRYELQIQSLELQAARAAERAATLSFSLADALGLDTAVPIIPAVDLDEAEQPVADCAAWQERALAGSLALRQAQTGVSIAAARERAVGAELRPRLSLFAYGRLNGPIVTEVPVLNNNIMLWGFGLTLNYSLSSLWSAPRKLSVARAATAQSRQSLDIAAERLRRDVQDAWQRHSTLRSELRTCRKSLELALENYAIVSTRYAQGMAIVTDMVDAAAVRLSAELNLQNARAALMFSHFRLRYLSNQL